MFISLLLLISAYLLGSIPTAVIVCRLFKLPDPRFCGSGNSGATNVARSGHKIAAILTLSIDFGKGVMALMIGQIATASPLLLAVMAILVVVGHIYSCFLNFRGGRGVATAFGLFAYYQPLLTIIIAVLWLLVFIGFRYSSLASVIAMLSATILFSLSSSSTSWQLSLAVAVIATIVIWRHRDNISRLIRGVEPKIQKS